MIPSNVLQRTFRIGYGNESGTGFTIDHDGKQYLVTAKHVVAGFKPTDSLNIFHEKQWKKLPCTLVGLAGGNTDVAVLAPSGQISPTYPLPASIGDLILGQDAYFLGFPYGLHSEIGILNSDFPLPLVKKACVSSMVIKAGGAAGMDYLLLDGHGNPGFSGGPVVFCPPNQLNSFRVAGIISSFQFEWDPVFLGGKETPLAYRYNTGIITAFSIQHAVDLISSNPIGALVK